MAEANCNLCDRRFVKRNGRQLACDVCREDGTLTAYRSQKGREWRAANRESHSANRKRYREIHRERIARERREWYLKNRDHALSYSREYAAANPDRRREWMDANRATVRQWVQRRRARLASNGVYAVTDRDLVGIMRRAGGRCLGCGQALTVQIPISRGGCHSVGNLAPMCKPCNSSKRDRTLTEWRKGGLVYSTRAGEVAGLTLV